MPGTDAPIGSTRSGVSDARNMKNSWMVVWGCNLQEGQREIYGSVLSSHDRNGGSYRNKSEVVKGYFCKA